MTASNSRDMHEWDETDFDAVLGPGVISRLTGYVPREADTAGQAEHDAALALLKQHFPDGEVIQQPLSPVQRRFIRDADGAIRRLTSRNFGTWMQHAAKAGGCTQPIRLSGHHIVASKATGEVIEHFDTANLPDGVLYRPCGTRRASLCPACARTYRYDAHQLIRAGLSGGKGVSSSVTTHPAVFATFTAPSFGPVHTRVVKHHACNRRGPCTCVPLPCRARRDNPVCPHDRLMSCTIRHNADDPRLGHSLCAQCYDYNHHIVWNHFAGRLWSRTIDKLARFTTRAGAKIRYAKVAEFQKRGVVHFHAIIRLDGDHKESLVAPPSWLDTGFLTALLREVAQDTTVITAPHPDKVDGWNIRWGKQLDIQPLRRGVGNDELSDHYVRYLAKYATKGTEAVGLNARRLTHDSAEQLTTPTHIGRLIGACWQLGRPLPNEFIEQIFQPDNEIKGSVERWICQNGHPPRRTRLRHCPACGSSSDASPPTPTPQRLGPYDRLRRWAHCLGFGGHFLTKSRAYSTTFGSLRAARHNHHIPTLNGRNSDGLVVLRQWAYRGSGWEANADAELARQAADNARARRLFKPDLAIN